MPNIDIRKLAEEPWEFKVLLEEDEEVVGEYMVTMSEDEYAEYGDDVEPHELIEATFRFLLSREEPEMILTQFKLHDVEKYFPEFPDEVRDYL